MFDDLLGPKKEKEVKTVTTSDSIDPQGISSKDDNKKDNKKDPWDFTEITLDDCDCDSCDDCDCNDDQGVGCCKV